MKNFYSGKKVFLTGHTGFKGSWLALWLTMMGAKVVGFSLKADEESLFNLAEVATGLEKSIIGDIRNSDEIAASVKNFQPEIILHLAAQPLVRDSYFDPRKTFFLFFSFFRLILWTTAAKLVGTGIREEGSK